MGTGWGRRRRGSEWRGEGGGGCRERGVGEGDKSGQHLSHQRDTASAGFLPPPAPGATTYQERKGRQLSTRNDNWPVPQRQK